MDSPFIILALVRFVTHHKPVTNSISREWFDATDNRHPISSAAGDNRAPLPTFDGAYNAELFDPFDATHSYIGIYLDISIATVSLMIAPSSIFLRFQYIFFRRTNEVFLTAFYHLHFTKSSDSKSIKHHSDRGYQKMGYEGRRIMECARSMAIPECQEEFVESESKFRKWIRKICCIACKMPDWKTALPRKMKSPSRIDWESGGRRHSCATRRAIAADDHLYVFL